MAVEGDLEVVASDDEVVVVGVVDVDGGVLRVVGDSGVGESGLLDRELGVCGDVSGGEYAVGVNESEGGVEQEFLVGGEL